MNSFTFPGETGCWQSSFKIIEITVCCMRHLRRRCIVMVWAVKYRPVVGSSIGVTDAFRLHYRLPWARIEIVFHHRILPLETVCYRRHHKKPGCKNAQPSPRIIGSVRVCAKHMRKHTKLWAILSWMVLRGPVCKKNYLPNSQDLPSLVVWALVHFSRRPGTGSGSSGRARKKTAAEENDERLPTEVLQWTP